MANVDKRISSLSQTATELDGSELLILEQSGTNKKVQMSTITAVSSAAAATAQAAADAAQTTADSAEETAGTALALANQALNTASGTTSTLAGNLQAPYGTRFAYDSTTGFSNHMLALRFGNWQTGWGSANNIDGIWICTNRMDSSVVYGTFYLALTLTSGAPLALYDEEGGTLLATAEMNYSTPGVVPFVDGSGNVWGWAWTKDGVPNASQTPLATTVEALYGQHFNVGGMTEGQEWTVRNLVYFQSDFNGGDSDDKLQIGVGFFPSSPNSGIAAFDWPLVADADYPQYIEIETKMQVIEDENAGVFTAGTYIRTRTTQRIIQTPASGEAQFAATASSPQMAEAEHDKQYLAGNIFLGVHMLATNSGVGAVDIAAWEVKGSTFERKLTNLES